MICMGFRWPAACCKVIIAWNGRIHSGHLETMQNFRVQNWLTLSTSVNRGLECWDQAQSAGGYCSRESWEQSKPGSLWACRQRKGTWSQTGLGVKEMLRESWPESTWARSWHRAKACEEWWEPWGGKGRQNQGTEQNKGGQRTLPGMGSRAGSTKIEWWAVGLFIFGTQLT